MKTKKGRENQKALNALSASGRQWIADLEKESRVLTESGAKASEVKKKNEELERAKREVAAQIARTAREMGLENKEAVELAKKLNAIPDEVSTSILLPGAKGSQKQADKLNERMKEMDARDRLEIVMEWMTNGYEAANKKYKDLKDKTVNVTLRYQETGQLASGVRVGNRVVNLGGFADGGPVPGRSPHPKADDKIIRVTSGEFMMQHSSHSKYGTDTLQRINRGEVDPAALSRLVKGFADGGPISHAQQGPMATERQTLTAQSVPAGRTTNQNTFVLPNVNPYALLAAAGHRLEGLR